MLFENSEKLKSLEAHFLFFFFKCQRSHSVSIGLHLFKASFSLNSLHWAFSSTLLEVNNSFWELLITGPPAFHDGDLCLHGEVLVFLLVL